MMQEFYVKRFLEKFNIIEANPVAMPLKSGNQKLNFAGINFLNRFNANPEKTHWTAAKRVLRYLKKTETYDITYIKSQQKMLAYVDSNWASDVGNPAPGFVHF